jgi:hypothetical protein
MMTRKFFASRKIFEHDHDRDRHHVATRRRDVMPSRCEINFATRRDELREKFSRNTSMTLCHEKKNFVTQHRREEKKIRDTSQKFFSVDRKISRHELRIFFS